MNGPIAQLAALVCHGNAFLSGRDFPAFFPANATCRFCDTIVFTEPNAPPAGLSPDAWIHALPEREVDGLRISFSARNDPAISDRLSAGFTGGGRSARIEVRRDDGASEFWSANWGLWNQAAPDQRIWRVTYSRDTTEPSTALASRNLALVRSALREQLEEILAFSRAQTPGAFTPRFDDALSTLDTVTSDPGNLRDIALPGQLSDDALAVLKAASRAWVFGGMGSWNDMSFERPMQTEYENVSDGLFNVLHEAIEAAVNSTYLQS